MNIKHNIFPAQWAGGIRPEPGIHAGDMEDMGTVRQQLKPLSLEERSHAYCTHVTDAATISGLLLLKLERWHRTDNS